MNKIFVFLNLEIMQTDLSAAPPNLRIISIAQKRPEIILINNSTTYIHSCRPPSTKAIVA